MTLQKLPLSSRGTSTYFLDIFEKEHRKTLLSVLESVLHKLSNAPT